MDVTPALAPIIVLGGQDAGEILTLQRAAYVTEAQAHDDPRPAAPRQTLAELRAELASADVTALGIRDRGRLVATVRLRHDPADPHTAEVAAARGRPRSPG